MSVNDFISISDMVNECCQVFDRSKFIENLVRQTIQRNINMHVNNLSTQEIIDDEIGNMIEAICKNYVCPPATSKRLLAKIQDQLIYTTSEYIYDNHSFEEFQNKIEKEAVNNIVKRLSKIRI